MLRSPSSRTLLVHSGNPQNQHHCRENKKFVHDFLFNNGIDKTRISFSGNGIYDSINSGNKNVDYRLARRVSVFIKKN